MLHFRTHSVLGNQYPEFQSEKTQTVQFKSHSCLPTADGNFNRMKNCIFSALSSTRKKGDEVLFRKHAMTSKRRLYPLTCVLNLPENRIWATYLLVTLYIFLRQHSCLPQDKSSYEPTQNSQKCLLKYTIPGGGIHSMRMIRHKWKRRPIVPTHMADASKVEWEPGRSHSQIKSNQIWAELSHSSIKRQWASSSSFYP